MWRAWPADLVLAFTALEAAALIALRRRSAGRLTAVDIVLQLLPGAALLGALRLALTGHGGWVIAAALLAAGAAHTADLLRRWRRP